MARDAFLQIAFAIRPPPRTRTRTRAGLPDGFFTAPGGEKSTKLDRFISGWNALGLFEAGRRLKDPGGTSPTRTPTLKVTDTAVEVYLPVELPLPNVNKVETARGRLVVATKDPALLEELKQRKAGRSRARSRASTRRPDLGGGGRALRWRVVRIESDLVPVTLGPAAGDARSGGAPVVPAAPVTDSATDDRAGRVQYAVIPTRRPLPCRARPKASAPSTSHSTSCAPAGWWCSWTTSTARTRRRGDGGRAMTPRRHQLHDPATPAAGCACRSSRPQAERVGLELLPGVNLDPTATPFTHNFDARYGITTGISAFDRCRTVQVWRRPQLGAAGPRARQGAHGRLIAKPGGVLVRAGAHGGERGPVPARGACARWR